MKAQGMKQRNIFRMNPSGGAFFAPVPPVAARLWRLFSGPDLGLTLYRGWTPIISKASEAILAELQGTEASFRWVLLSEREGIAEILYSLAGTSHYFVEAPSCESHRVATVREDEPTPKLCAVIEGIAWEIERLTMEACIVCGGSTNRKMHFGQLLPLCAKHEPQAVEEDGDDGLENVWRLAVEWQSTACSS